MTLFRFGLLALVVAVVFSTAVGCGGDDDDDSSGDDISSDDDDSADDDDSSDDDTVDDDTTDDDSVDDDTSDDDTATDDDTADDDIEYADDYIAPWPQQNIPPRVYDESPSAGPLRVKAEEYDQWNLDWHQPYYGGIVETDFVSTDYDEVANYYYWNDSTEWTGVYLTSQAMRYYVTGEAQAKANVLKAASMLSGNLHVTGRPGFLARYHAPKDPLIYQGDEWCDSNEGEQDRCHRVESGEYAGDWWWGETSRDMYNGWFLGLGMAFDLVDDEDMREQIRMDMAEVLDELISTDWVIIDEAGEPTTKAPQVQPPFRISWLLIGYHVTGHARFADQLRPLLLNDYRKTFGFAMINFFNRYVEYFGHCLSHEFFYNWLRLSKVYFSPDDAAFFAELFETRAHEPVRLTHNAFFNAVYMSQGAYDPEAESPDPYLGQLIEDLTDFRPAPNYQYYLPDRDPDSYTLDPVSVLLGDLSDQYPGLFDLIFGHFHYQALEAFPIPEQCSTDFLFQRNPFQIYACGADRPTHVFAGVDYLIGYWMAAYHGFVTKDM
ncbi:hypothetical protein KDL45_01520 [bacterium]|nr:hypothetical protein [bacterium]